MFRTSRRRAAALVAGLAVAISEVLAAATACGLCARQRPTEANHRAGARRVRRLVKLERHGRPAATRRFAPDIGETALELSNKFPGSTLGTLGRLAGSACHETRSADAIPTSLNVTECRWYWISENTDFQGTFGTLVSTCQ
jgi:hypothetical protein